MKNATATRVAISLVLTPALASAAHAKTVLEDILARKPLVLHTTKSRAALELCVVNLLSDEGTVSVFRGEDRTILLAYHRESGLRGVKIKVAITLLGTGEVQVRHADDKLEKFVSPLTECFA